MAWEDLSPQQQAFVLAFVGPANGNAAQAMQAARHAGYDGTDADLAAQGETVRRIPAVRSEIERCYAERCLSASETLARLSDQARGAGDYYELTADDRPVLNVKRLLEDGKAHLIKSVKVSEKGLILVELHDAQAALNQLGRHYKLFTDRVDIEGLDDAIDRELAKLAAGREAAAPGTPPGAERAERPLSTAHDTEPVRRLP